MMTVMQTAQWLAIASVVVGTGAFGCALWASTVEPGAPGWRSALAGAGAAVSLALVTAAFVVA